MSSTTLGFAAAAVSCVSFGSYAVPVKGRIATEVNIDPLAMQTYKTAMSFFTCWLVLLCGEKFSFTPWGFVSGLFWVPGGTCGMYAVRNAGLAVSQGTWSTLKLLVGFVWGIFIFNEGVRSKWGASVAIGFMICGLWGMTYCSAQRVEEDEEEPTQPDLTEPLLPADPEPEHHHHHHSGAGEDNVIPETMAQVDEAAEEGCESIGEAHHDHDRDRDDDDDTEHQKSRRYALGLFCACIDGLWGGSILVPMHFAKHKSEGLGYIISFAIGATVVLCCVWVLRILGTSLYKRQGLKDTFYSLPSLHLRKMWLPGGIAGLVWSIGNVSAILSVTYLGEGLGFSICQAQMIVAGMWGVLWYREVRGTLRILSWFASAVLTLCGILLLSHEHIKTPSHGLQTEGL